MVRMLDRVARAPHRYSEVIVCCPFIGDDLLPRILALFEWAQRGSYTIRVITSSDAAYVLANRLLEHQALWRRSVVTRSRLHAKVYVAIARRRTDSEAIVTSANLTRGGTVENIEFGIRAVPSSDAGRRLVDDIHHFVRRLAA